mgnify:CR=1 FL=1
MGRWSDLAEWRGPTPNQGPAMVEQRGLVTHIAEGSFEGTIAWCKNPDANVSAHFVVAKDGRIAQMVDTDVAAWTQRAGNGYWLSIENEGFSTGSLTAAQIEAGAQLFARGHREYGWKLQIANTPAGLGLGHHSMGSNEGPCNWSGQNWGHCACPGAKIIAQKPIMLARAIQIVNGETDVPNLYHITSTDAEHNNDYYLSNGVNRRGPIRTNGGVFVPATQGATRIELTDGGRTVDGVKQAWPSYLDDVAGPLWTAGDCNCDCGDGAEAHKHAVELSLAATTLKGETGPAVPTVPPAS